jgi:hypothetical protein
VTSIVAALITDDDVGLFSQNVNPFAFPFISPLSAHYDTNLTHGLAPFHGSLDWQI